MDNQSSIIEENGKLNYDIITGLLNRQYLYNNFSDNIHDFIVALLDIDNFKYINDTFGHRFGDNFLNVFARRLSRVVEEYGKVFLHTGDEFLLLLPKNDFDLTINRIENILKEMQKPFKISNYELVATVSIGVYIPQSVDSIDDVIRKVEIAMREAKQKGKGQYLILQKHIEEKIQRKSILSTELMKSINNKELYILYQPIIDGREGKLAEVEALIRWQNKELGEISPAEFIPIAEETGFIRELGYWIIKRVCKQIKQWKKRGINLKVAINISPNQLMEDGIIEKYKAIVDSEGVDFKQIKFEITETQILDLKRENFIKLKKIKDLGTGISLDDFGTGYSSIKNMAFFPISELKIDKSFIDCITKDEKIQRVVFLIILTAHKLGYKVTAEGVETKEQFEKLLLYGCDKIQGYYIGKPMKAEHIADIINNFVVV